ncbi:hypothetical protein ABZ202_16430 [Streptomyces sp. NPDC006186]|uniref:hypothetical protein n=1 Tax=Streptomyces sp. NPDC006186 TaxID=3155248 RepID=UPI0033B9F7B4
MVRRPVAWVVTVLLFAEALGIAAVNWFLGMVADRQQMSLAGVDPDVMETSSKAGAVVFGLYFALCAVAALLVAVRDRAPGLFGRILLISAAVVHALLGALAWGLIGWTAFVFMVVMLALIVLLLMTYDGQEGAGAPGAAGNGPAEPETGSARPDGTAPADAGAPAGGETPAGGTPTAPGGVPAQHDGRREPEAALGR